MQLQPAAAQEILAPLASPEKVRALEAALLDLPQVDLHTQHLVHGKVSARAILIPAGTVLTGALTNCDNLCIVLGDITVTTDDGARRVTGFAMLPARAGYKRAGIAHADTWWITVHHTNLTDLAEVEQEMTAEADSLQTRTKAIAQETASWLSE